MKKYALLRTFISVIALFMLSSLTGCEEEPVSITPELTVRAMIATSGLGDLSYNDNILRGIMEKQREDYFRLEYHSPQDDAGAEQMLREWQQNDDLRYYYTILAASEFEHLARKTMPTTETSHYLMFDTRAEDLTIPSFHFSGYGVSFLAGIAAYTQVGAETVAYIGGQQHESYIEECYDGFRDGYIYAGGKGVVKTYLSTTQAGFSMPRRAYEMADSLYRFYPFIYAMAGRSNNGIYEYLRDYPQVNGYTAGVDVDQSAYSNKIIGSMIKEIGRCAGQYISLWMKGTPIPMRQNYTLSSGFLAFKVADPYKEKLEQVVAIHLPIAIQKEIEYEQNPH